MARRNPTNPITVDTRRGLVILDPRGMPINLGKSLYEDSPEQALPVVPYHGRNILPTPLGYKSAFYPRVLHNGDWAQMYEVREKEAIQKSLINDIVVYQAATGARVHWAMTNQGLWAWKAGAYSEEHLYRWNPLGVIEQTSPARLWSTCTIADMTYFYCQGEPVVFVLGDLARIRTLAGAGATLLYEDEKDFFGLVSQTPTFLNMEGQIGIFKAANRLGFWDSDNSIAWSSAIDRMDFKPDATTFAGITQFADVVGRITKVLSHGKGFIIYSTGSMVLCTELQNSVEKFKGSAILSSTGVLYPFQVDYAKTDLSHYAWTPNGLVQIDNGSADFIEPEVTHYLLNNYQLVKVTVIGDTTVCLSVAASADDPHINFQARMLVDGKGNPGWFRPIELERPETYWELLKIRLDGSAPEAQELWDNSYPDEEDEPIPPINNPRPLVPLMSGVAFNGVVGSFGATVPEDMRWINHLTWPTDVTQPSNRYPGRLYYLDDYKVSNTPNVDPATFDYEFFSKFPGLAGSEFEDLHPEAYTQKISDCLAEWTRVVNVVTGLRNRGTATGGKGRVQVGDGYAQGGDYYECYYGERPPVWEGDPALLPGGEVIVQNVPVDLKSELADDGCSIRIVAEVASYKLTAKFNIIDEFTDPCGGGAGYMAVYRDGNKVAMFNYWNDVEEVEGSRETVVLFDSYISGWGYLTGNELMPYVKVSRSRSCISREVWKFPLDEDSTFEDLSPDPEFRTDLDEWYPGYITRTKVYPGYSPNPDSARPPDFELGWPSHNPIWAAFQDGIVAPLYPTYDSSYLLDTKLGKWGMLSIPHIVLYDTRPKNTPNLDDPEIYWGNTPLREFPAGAVLDLRSRNGFMPSVADQYGDYNKIFAPMTGLPVYLTGRAFYSQITYGKIGFRRAGTSKITSMGVELQPYKVGTPSTGLMVALDASWDNVTTPDGQLGDWYDSQNVQRTVYHFRNSGEAPLMQVGRWFSATLYGEFDVSGLYFYGIAEGRLRTPTIVSGGGCC